MIIPSSITAALPFFDPAIRKSAVFLRSVSASRGSWQ